VGVILSEVPTATPSPVVTGTPPNWFIPSEPYVGPIRSGRLTYNQIGGMFPNSCLVYASAAWDIGEMLDACEIVFGVDKTTPNSALLPVTRLRELAEQSLNPRQPVNYSGNLFSDAVPEGGQPASAIKVFYHSYTQSAWQYDPISGTYLRSTDLADGTGTLIPARSANRKTCTENGCHLWNTIAIGITSLRSISDWGRNILLIYSVMDRRLKSYGLPKTANGKKQRD
jgi:hypothetical protein